MTAAVPAYRVQLPWCAVRRSASLVIEGSKMNASLSLEAKLSCCSKDDSDADASRERDCLRFAPPLEREVKTCIAIMEYCAEAWK